MTRLGRFVLHHLRPPGDGKRDERGRCSVCGAQSRFRFNTWILPPDMVRDLSDPGLVQAFRARESLWCGECGASLRVRRIADVLLSHYADRAVSLAELVHEPGFRALRIAEVNSIGTAHDVLAAHPGLRYSEYPEEDIQALSYGDGEFDLVLTSDTLEHVPDFEQALRETRRVLRPGGRHVFTVPVTPSRTTTVARASETEAGSVVHHELPQHHCRGSGPFALLTRRHEDLLAYSDFGLDLVDRVREAGFEPEVHFLRVEDPDVDVAIVFSARAT
jgi:SAM-dependent methyltransferase